MTRPTPSLVALAGRLRDHAEWLRTGMNWKPDDVVVVDLDEAAGALLSDLKSAPPAEAGERETIVAFVRQFRLVNNSDYTYQQQIANAIERAEHLKPEDGK